MGLLSGRGQQKSRGGYLGHAPNLRGLDLALATALRFEEPPQKGRGEQLARQRPHANKGLRLPMSLLRWFLVGPYNKAQRPRRCAESVVFLNTIPATIPCY